MLKNLNPIGQLVTGLFEYNKKNYDEDREQRQSMEYQVMAMRIEQTGLWREDVRNVIEFTQTKVEMYMLVSTLLLGFCATAMVKAIVVPGTPEWLTIAHTLLLCGSFMFLLLSMILGINAYVASQAYMVRLNTQYVRLPIPTWEQLEACRTYGSTFEKQQSSQMFRVPFAGGYQERGEQGRQEEARNEPPPTSLLPSGPNSVPRRRARSSSPPRQGAAGPQTDPVGAATSDPWGLERRGDHIPELHPLVNTSCAKQRHIWLAREAGKFYLTHEAFCRVAMSLGTSYLALFFGYYCLTYCLVEDGAPQAALVGMICCVMISVSMVYMETNVPLPVMTALSAMQTAPPVLQAITIYLSSPNGSAGVFDYFVCVGMFIHGSWLFVFLKSMRVRETDTGVFLPMAFQSSLLLDSFGRFPHQARMRRPAASMDRLSKTKAGSLFPGLPVANRQSSKFDEVGHDKDGTLPSMGFIHGPFRPEDASPSDSKSQDVLGDTLTPDTFFHAGTEEAEKGNILQGRKPGEQVWHTFRMAVGILAFLWWIGGAYSIYVVSQGWGHFPRHGSWEVKAERSTIVSVALLGTSRSSWKTERIQTRWPSAMARPTGLACDPTGSTFVTAGRGKGGRRAVLHGSITQESAPPSQGYSRSKLAFTAAPACPGLQIDGQGELIQDLALHKCTEPAGCSALVLPKKGHSLVSCPLTGEGEDDDIVADGTAGLSLFQRAAMVRRISVENTVPNVEQVLAQDVLKKNASKFRDLSSDFIAEGFLTNSSVPLARAWLDDYVGEEPTSLSVASCPWMEGGSSECPVVGTSAGRVVQLGPGHVGDASEAAWVPRRLLMEDDGDSVQPGAFAEVGGGQLGVLNSEGRHLHVLDTQVGAGWRNRWRLPTAPKGLQWSSVCASGDAVYALDSGESPDVWRFTPK